MLTTRSVQFGGKDAGRDIVLTELPALVADRYARAALTRVGADPVGGVVALALKHMPEVRALGADATPLLAPFVAATCEGAPFTLADLRDWRNIDRLLHAALAVHVDFLIGREMIDVPVAMRAQVIMNTAPDVRVTFCSPHIAAVLQSHHATYRELETVLGTQDVFNLVEIINVEAVQEWHAAQHRSDT